MKIIQNLKKGPLVHLVFKGSENNAFYDFAKAHSSFAGKVAEIYYLPSKDGDGEYLLGLGEEEKADLEAVRKAFFALAKAQKSNKTETVQVALSTLDGYEAKDVLQAAIEGALQSEYSFSRKSKSECEEENEENEEKEEQDLSISFIDLAEGLDFDSAYTEVRNLIDGIFFTRDLVNQTSNELYPQTLAEQVEEKFAGLPVEIEILDEEKIQEIGMKAFYSVAKGSQNPPRFITVRYMGDESSEELTALVGKAVTYDSGGYCMKSPGGMSTMHCDMGGAGTVLGTLYALAKNKAKVNAVAVVAACENLISGSAFKTGDIIASLSGKTIEVLNTDAEGRLTLADAIYYATDALAADKVIDLATLTGAVVSALASEFTGAITNNMDFYRAFETACTEVGEKVWLLPNDDNLRELNKKSKVADLTNTSAGGAGTVTAGQFVGEFLAREIPWVHLDIAGTAYNRSANGYLPERASGVHVKALYRLLSK